MADEPVVPPGQAPPAAGEVAVPPAAPPIVEAPPAEAAPVVEAPPVVVETAPAPAREPSLVEAATAPGTETPPVEPPKEVAPETKPAEVVEPPKDAPPVEPLAETPPVETQAPPALEYKYELPEGLALNDDQRTELHGAMDAYRADPSNLQPLLALHDKFLREAVEATRAAATQNQTDVWAEMVSGWRTQSMADELIGGAAWNTARGVVAQARDAFVSDHPRDTPEWHADRNEFIGMMDLSGIGNHPAFLRFLYRAGRAIREPSAREAVTSDFKHVPQTRQDGKNPLHDNPRSAQLNGR